MSTPDLGLLHIQASQNSKEVTANAAFDGLDLAANALATFPTADADVALTQAQLASGIVLKFTGATTADRHVNLPVTLNRLFFVLNATTGGHNLIVQVTGAPGTTVSILAAQGITALFSDGTNISNASPAAGLLGTLFDPLDPTIGWWREEWNTSSTSPANTTPFGLMQWDAHNWVAGSQNCSIQQGSWDANHYRFMHVVTDASSGHGVRIFQRLLQSVNIGIAWKARIKFRLSSTANIIALAGFGHDDSGKPLTWFLGMRFDTTLGSPDTNFMVGAGASDGSTGTFTSSGVAADTNAHDLLIEYVSSTQVKFTMDAAAPVTVTVSATLDDAGVALYPGLWCYGAAAAAKSVDCSLFAFKYTGLTG